MRLLMIMLKTYFKQALALSRQNCLFSTLYIAGTGLAIAMTVVKLAPVYPEENRANILYLTSASFHSDEKKSTLQAGLSYQALQDWVYPLKIVGSAAWCAVPVSSPRSRMHRSTCPIRPLRTTEKRLPPTSPIAAAFPSLSW